jgi:hypothetical protein
MSKKHVQRKQKRSLLTLSRIDLDEMLDCLCQLEEEIKELVFEKHLDAGPRFWSGGGNRIRTDE